MKKPMTARAEMLVIKTLYQLHERGHDANAALDRSTLNNWLDVFAPKEKEIPNLKRESKPVEPAMTPEEWDRSKSAREKVLGMVRGVIRRVI